MGRYATPSSSGDKYINIYLYDIPCLCIWYAISVQYKLNIKKIALILTKYYCDLDIKIYDKISLLITKNEIKLLKIEFR